MTARRVLVLSGVNLALLGEREPEIYGSSGLDEIVAAAVRLATELGIDLDHLQSDSESELVRAVHRAGRDAAALIVNPGAFTHYSWALHDALAAFDGPVVELHLSNPDARESWRRTSVVAPVATGQIAGFGASGYLLAVRAVAELIGLDAGA